MSPERPSGAEDWSDAGHALGYLARADGFPHRAEGEGVVDEIVPADARRILDLGTGDGRLLAVLRVRRPQAECVALDVSPPMLAAARARFAGDPLVQVRAHDLAEPLPTDLGAFDAVVSSFAIHHVDDGRKRTLYAEVRSLLRPGGVFANLEHVASPTERLHVRFLELLGVPDDGEDGSNRLAPVEDQLTWLRDLGFDDVDCLWKWREMALLTGLAPIGAGRHEALTGRSTGTTPA